MRNARKPNGRAKNCDYFAICIMDESGTTTILKCGSLDKTVSTWIEVRESIHNEGKPMAVQLTFNSIPILTHNFASKSKSDEDFVEILQKDELTEYIVETISKLQK
jgi:hypothetical protein